MSSQRVLSDHQRQEQESQDQNFDNSSSHQSKANKSGSKSGRPKGKKGRPKGGSKIFYKRKEEEEEEWEETFKPKEKQFQPKDQTSIEGYIKIIDYLKKIDYDENTLQNKMNPYNAMTANCFWYATSAEYFSFNFFRKNNPTQAAQQIIEKTKRLTINIPNRISKVAPQQATLDFETEELKKHGMNLAQKVSNLIPVPMYSRAENIQKKTNLTCVAEDDQFISSTRAIIYNYIINKIKTSQKWENLFQGFFKQNIDLPNKTFPKVHKLEFEEEIAFEQEQNLFDILRKQAKKKMGKSRDQSNSKSQKEEDPEALYQSPQNQKKQQQLNQENNSQEEDHNEKSKQIINEEEEQQKEIIKMQEQIIENEKSQQDNSITIQKQYTHQDIILDCIQHLPIDNLVSILQSSLPNTRPPNITKQMMPFPSRDPLQFIFQLHPDEQKYLQYMKQNRKKIYRAKVANNIHYEQQQKEGQYQDAKCQICTDGDYTDDNLIVFCSMCNISLHQRCVGLNKVPAESWICDLCESFGPAGINVPCPLCDVKGGAMKRTGIHIDSTIFKDTNPNYYEYSKTCTFKKQKEEYQAGDNNVLDENGGYYDYFIKSTYPTNVPVCHYIWTHYVCAIWIPQCYFQEKNSCINIKGVENIEKKRYRHQCFICKKTRSGAAVKCQEHECDKFYHPECARKRKVYMQQLNLQKLRYLIFCQQHEPLKITRQIQYKKKKSREEIIKFARMIEKYIETYRIATFPYKLLKSLATSSFMEKSEKKPDYDLFEKKKAISKVTDDQFLKQLINNLSKVKMMSVRLEKVDNGFKIVDVHTPSKRQIRKSLNRYDEFWNSIKNGDSNEDNFKRYERIMIDNQKLRSKLQVFLNGPSAKNKQEKKEKKVGRKRGKHAIQQLETLIQQQGGIFCICKKPYENETDMFQCEICGEWYHFKCIGFMGSQEDAQSMEFKCMKCMKFQNQETKNTRFKKYQMFFKPDCVLFNYVPPTPDLMSQKDQEIVEPFKLNKEQNQRQKQSTFQKLSEISKRQASKSPLGDENDHNAENRQFEKMDQEKVEEGQ